MKEQVIHLEPHDDAVSVRDKLGWVQATHVLLVFPPDPGVDILTRRLDLVLIQREATRRQAQLALITRNPQLIDHADELGIAHFATIEASHRRTWRMAQAQISVERSEEQVPLDPELAEAASRLHSLSEPRPIRLPRGVRFGLAGFGAALFLVGNYFVLPGATIHLTPAANQVTVTTTVTADPGATEVRVGESIIPARSIGVVVEDSATIEVTGFTDLPTEKARGTALFTNLIPDQVTIPVGTVVRSSAGQPVRFVTLTDATLPGKVGETVEVPIEAVEPGYEGNLPIGRINEIEGPLSARLAVANPQSTRGGDVTVIPAIGPQDYDRVLALLLQQLQQRAFAEMQTDPDIALLDTEFVPIQSLTIVLTDSQTYDGYIGQAANHLTLSMRVTIQGIAIDERRAREVVYAKLAEKIGSGFEIIPDSLIFRRGEVTNSDEQRRVTFIMQGAGSVAAAVDPTTVRQMVRGQPTNEALALLDRELTLAEPPQIDLWPPLWLWMPVWEGRIVVRITHS